MLKAGGLILVFPEDPRRPIHPKTGLRPFQCGFAGLGGMYRKECGEVLPFFPTAVIPEQKLIRIGRPRQVPQEAFRRQYINAFCQQLEEDVVRLKMGAS